MQLFQSQLQLSLQEVERKLGTKHPKSRTQNKTKSARPIVAPRVLSTSLLVLAGWDHESLLVWGHFRHFILESKEKKEERQRQAQSEEGPVANLQTSKFGAYGPAGHLENHTKWISGDLKLIKSIKSFESTSVCQNFDNSSRPIQRPSNMAASLIFQYDSSFAVPSALSSWHSNGNP